ncbi:MAG TPA: hypothetical protein VEP50_02680 [bacterium]|nr:hypothetical protein [bacterium]
MERDASVMAWVRALLTLPGDTGRHFGDEMEAVRRRIETVHRCSVTHDVQPAGTPRLRRSGD